MCITLACRALPTADSCSFPSDTCLCLVEPQIDTNGAQSWGLAGCVSLCMHPCACVCARLPRGKTGPSRDLEERHRNHIGECCRPSTSAYVSVRTVFSEIPQSLLEDLWSPWPCRPVLSATALSLPAPLPWLPARAPALAAVCAGGQGAHVAPQAPHRPCSPGPRRAPRVTMLLLSGVPCVVGAIKGSC